MPSSTRYHPFYCEENLWWWCKSLSSDALDNAFVLIISNPERRAAVGLQRLGRPPGDFMVWDYHVVGILQSATGAYLVDFDTSAESMTMDARWWFDTQEQLLTLVVDDYQPQFRPIPARSYLEKFSSSRRHMLREDGSYLQPAPHWPCIVSTSDDLSEIEALLAPDIPEGWHSISAIKQALKF